MPASSKICGGVLVVGGEHRPLLAALLGGLQVAGAHRVRGGPPYRAAPVGTRCLSRSSRPPARSPGRTVAGRLGLAPCGTGGSATHARGDRSGGRAQESLLAPAVGDRQPPVPAERLERRSSGPGADWRRLYSARSTMRRPPGRPSPGRSRPRPARRGPGPRRRSRLEDRVEHRRRRQRVAVELARAQLGADGGLVIEFSGIGGVSPAPLGLGVAPRGQPPHQRLRHVLERVEAADRVAVERGVADRQLALVAGGRAPGGPPGWTAPSGSTPRTRACRFSSRAGQRRGWPGTRRPSAGSARPGSPARSAWPGRRRRRGSAREE